MSPKIIQSIVKTCESQICLPMTQLPLSFHPFFVPSIRSPLCQSWSAATVKATVGQHQHKARRLVARQQQQKITVCTCMCVRCSHICVRVLIIKIKHVSLFVGQTAVWGKQSGACQCQWQQVFTLLQHLFFDYPSLISCKKITMCESDRDYIRECKHAFMSRWVCRSIFRICL